MKAVDDQLSTDLGALGTNRQRCDRLIAEIPAERPLTGLSKSDVAAVHRIGRLLGSPGDVLREIQSHAKESLRRLYRQRNLVLHGGFTQGIGLSATLRTAAPLVGAGVDRIVHAQLTAGFEPLETASRAEFELLRAGMPGASGHRSS